jgi:hypothetical protein
MVNCNVFISRLLEPSSKTLLDNNRLLDEFVRMAMPCSLYNGKTDDKNSEILRLAEEFSAKLIQIIEGYYGTLAIYDGILVIFKNNKNNQKESFSYYVFKNLLYGI